MIEVAKMATTKRPSRRAIFRAAGGLAALAASAAPAGAATPASGSPDAALIRLADRMDTHRAELRRFNARVTDGGDAAEAELAGLLATETELVDAISTTRAASTAGLQAKARALRHYGVDGEEYLFASLAMSMAADLLGPAPAAAGGATVG